VFCHKTLNLDHYVSNISEPFFEEVTDDERQCGCFQQDSAAMHLAHHSVSALEEVFSDKYQYSIVASRITRSLLFVAYLCGNKRKSM
jgi:hypothetical protein